jgi:hypothetical protein
MTTGHRVPKIKKALLVEFCDEVSTRLSAGLAEAGLQLKRVCNAFGVLWQFASHRPEFAIVNIHTLGECGWPMARKRRLE